MTSRSVKVIVYLIVVTFSVMTTSCSDIHNKVEEGKKYFTTGHYNKAFKVFKNASSESSEAKYYLGTMYANGFFVEKNTDIAEKWYEKAIGEGSVDAMTGLGLLRLSMGSVDESMQLLKSAAQKGSVRAYVILVFIYKKNNMSSEIAELFSQVYLSEDPVVKYVKYLENSPESYEGIVWNSAFLQDQSQNASFKLGKMFFDKKMDEFMPYALFWFNYSAHNGNKEAMKYLVAMYRFGLGGAVDCSKSTYFYKKINPESVPVYEFGNCIVSDQIKLN